MKKFFEAIRNLLGGGNNKNISPPVMNLDTQLELIKHIEQNHKIDPGRRIHSFEFLEFVLGLDLEITNTYRLVVFEGQEKKYSFSIKCQPGEYDRLKAGLKQAVEFLSSERRVKNLPNNDILKGHFFGS